MSSGRLSHSREVFQEWISSRRRPVNDKAVRDVFFGGVFWFIFVFLFLGALVLAGVALAGVIFRYHWDRTVGFRNQLEERPA